MTHPDNDTHAHTKKRYKYSQSERRKRRENLSSVARYGEGGRFDRLAHSLGEIPILGDTALLPMRGFLSNTSKLYQATHTKEGELEISNLGDIKGVVGDVVKAVKDMKK